MSKTRPPYPAEYRAELARLVREDGRLPSDLAREFEPSAQSITNWVAQAEIDNGRRDGLSTATVLDVFSRRIVGWSYATTCAPN